MLDNLRLYLANFPGQTAKTLFVDAQFPRLSPEAAIAAARDALGITGEVGEPLTAHGMRGRVERSLDRHFLLRLESPVTGLLSLYGWNSETGSGIHLIGYLFTDDAADYIEREQAAWRDWLEGVASKASVDAPTA